MLDMSISSCHCLCWRPVPALERRRLPVGHIRGDSTLSVFSLPTEGVLGEMEMELPEDGPLWVVPYSDTDFD